MLLAEIPLSAAWMKPVVTIGCLAALWTWETIHPFLARPRGRIRHAAHNVAIAVLNTVVLAMVFAGATVGVANWTAYQRVGLLHLFELPALLRLLLAILLLDAWLYVWHWANHRVPLLWRFHRMHHADDEMDVTTATRFHLGEHLGSATLRLGLIPLLGIEAFHLLVYETVVVAVTMFHHANISLGRWDAALRWLIVTPDMHKIHHSDLPTETNSNYSTVFSWWDRLARTFRMRKDCSTLQFGLDEFRDKRWQTVGGMLQTPFIQPPLREDGRVG